MKRLLIISPYFPPSNAADMQRIRMSLLYFKEFGWDAEVVSVAPEYADINIDPLLEESLPSGLKSHYVKAFSKRWTSKLGLGSIAIRSLWFYKKKVNALLNCGCFDLIYFSTTQFPVCILGAYWKKRFGIPYVIDMQDPWHSDYYMTRPKSERPPKYWFSYRLNKYLEPIAMRTVDGLISVSEAYINTLKKRYPEITNTPSATITFGAFPKDNELVKQHGNRLKPAFSKGRKNLIYIGRGGKDMHRALSLLFGAFKKGIDEEPELFAIFKFHFIGTSYAAAGQGKATIAPLAEEFELSEFVAEQTNRIPFYEALAGLQAADGLIVPGSDDKQYTASKIYPYIMAAKPLLGIFHPSSSAVQIIKECHAGEVITLGENETIAYQTLKSFLQAAKEARIPSTNWDAFELYTAKEMTKKQCELFDIVLLNAKN